MISNAKKLAGHLPQCKTGVFAELSKRVLLHDKPPVFGWREAGQAARFMRQQAVVPDICASFPIVIYPFMSRLKISLISDFPGILNNNRIPKAW